MPTVNYGSDRVAAVAASTVRDEADWQIVAAHKSWLGQSQSARTVFSTPIPALTGTHTGTKQKFELYIVLDLGSSNRSGMHFSPLLTGRPLIFSTGIFAPT